MHPPPLPEAWPYPPRPAPPALVARAASLPGLGSGWTLEAPADLDLGAGPGALAGAFGRGGVTACGEVVLRPYRRGGLVRHLNPRFYPGPGRFRQECAVHRVLWQAGLPTVEPLGFAWRRLLGACEGVYLTRLAPGQPWPRTWDPAALPQVRGILDALVAWGLYAPDLNATNFLIQPGGQVLALDWDRAAWTGGPDLAGRYRDRLARSLTKLGAPPELVI